MGKSAYELLGYYNFLLVIIIFYRFYSMRYDSLSYTMEIHHYKFLNRTTRIKLLLLLALMSLNSAVILTVEIKRLSLLVELPYFTGHLICVSLLLFQIRKEAKLMRFSPWYTLYFYLISNILFLVIFGMVYLLKGEFCSDSICYIDNEYKDCSVCYIYPMFYSRIYLDEVEYQSVSSSTCSLDLAYIILSICFSLSLLVAETISRRILNHRRTRSVELEYLLNITVDQ